MLELVERKDGLFDVIYDGQLYREACFLSEAYAYSRPYVTRGNTFLVLRGTTRLPI